MGVNEICVVVVVGVVAGRQRVGGCVGHRVIGGLRPLSTLFGTP